MGKVMTANEFVAKAKDVANNYKTLYVMGCFGAPLNSKNKKRYTTNHPYNKDATRTRMINNASSDTFGFDCVCLIKGILWGWNGNKNHVYGGATYESNGVADDNADVFISSKHCSNVSSDFANIVAGEVVWMNGHIGIYIDNGKVVECTPAWANKVQITNLTARKWLKHGKLKHIDYTIKEAATDTATNTSEKKGSITVNPGTWFVRTGPGTNYDTIMVVNGGTKLDYYGIENGWYKLSNGYIGPKAVKTTSTKTVSYYKKCASKHTSIVDALKSINVDSSFLHRSKIAKANGISGYLGSPSQNVKMLDLLKQGKLIKSK